MKAFFLGLCLITLLPEGLLAQEAAPVQETPYLTIEENLSPEQSASKLLLGLSSIQWNQDFDIHQNALTVSDTINYSGLLFDIQKEIIYYRWGWNIGALFGSGQAVAGGNNSSISYQKSNVTFTIWGLSARVFYRLSGRVNAGLSVLGFNKDIDMPVDNVNQTVDTGNKTNATALLDLNLRLFANWDFYSGLGPLKEKATVWKVGVNYRF